MAETLSMGFQVAAVIAALTGALPAAVAAVLALRRDRPVSEEPPIPAR